MSDTPKSNTVGGTRYINVPCEKGIVAKVRVVSEHPDDDSSKQALYFYSYLDEKITADREALKNEQNAEKIKARLKALSELTVERDRARRSVLDNQLKDHHSGEEIKEILGMSTSENLLQIQLMNAVWGYQPLYTEPSPSDTKPKSD